MFIICLNDDLVATKNKYFQTKKDIKKIIYDTKLEYLQYGKIYTYVLYSKYYKTIKISVIPYNTLNPIERVVNIISIFKIPNKIVKLIEEEYEYEKEAKSHADDVAEAKSYADDVAEAKSYADDVAEAKSYADVAAAEIRSK